MSEDNTQKIKITFSNIHILDEIHCHDIQTINLAFASHYESSKEICMYIRVYA